MREYKTLDHQISWKEAVEKKRQRNILWAPARTGLFSKLDETMQQRSINISGVDASKRFSKLRRAWGKLWTSGKFCKAPRNNHCAWNENPCSMLSLDAKFRVPGVTSYSTLSAPIVEVVSSCKVPHSTWEKLHDRSNLYLESRIQAACCQLDILFMTKTRVER